jgi:hypothetical protein
MTKLLTMVRRFNGLLEALGDFAGRERRRLGINLGPLGSQPIVRNFTVYGELAKGRRNVGKGPISVDRIGQGFAGKELHMAFSLSVLGGLLVVGFAFFRLKARKGAKQDIPKLFP